MNITLEKYCIREWPTRENDKIWMGGLEMNFIEEIEGKHSRES
jgi:hypothetical protein